MLKTLHLKYSAIVADNAGGATEKEGEHDFQPSTIRGDVQSLINDDTQEMLLILKRKNAAQNKKQTQYEWEEGKICPLPSTAKQSSFPTMYKSHLYSSLYEAYFAVLLDQYKHTDSHITPHPNGIMQPPDFEFHNVATLHPTIFGDETSVYIEYKPTYPSEQTILHTFRLLYTLGRQTAMICYGNPLELTNDHCMTKEYSKSKGCKRQKVQTRDGVKVILIKCAEDCQSLEQMSVVPPQYIDTRWVFAINPLDKCMHLCEHGRLLDEDDNTYYIADGVKAETSHLSLMKHPVLCNKETHTACVLQCADEDIDLAHQLKTITNHVTILNDENQEPET